jgi:hypothetical protein
MSFSSRCSVIHSPRFLAPASKSALLGEYRFHDLRAFFLDFDRGIHLPIDDDHKIVAGRRQFMDAPPVHGLALHQALLNHST